MSGREPERIRCEDCLCAVHPDEILHDEREDDLLCPRCFENRMQNYAERDYERMCEDFHDGGSSAWPDAERKRMEEARKLKR